MSQDDIRAIFAEAPANGLTFAEIVAEAKARKLHLSDGSIRKAVQALVRHKELTTTSMVENRHEYTIYKKRVER